MSGVPGKLRRLRGRSGAELVDRVRQAATAWVERSGLGGALGLTAAPLDRILGIPDATREMLLTRVRDRASPASLPGLQDPRATAAIIQERCPEEARALLSRAERAAAGRFDLLGFTDLAFGTPIDWQFEPNAGRRAPLAHWSRVPYLNTDLVGDHKVVWEVNRHQWLVTLGQAYALTGNERWAGDIARVLDEWLDANPPKIGINWASSLEVSFRAISWLTALRFLRNSPSLTPQLYARLLESLQLHGRHLESYLSTYFSPNTHLTGEALGLFYLGTLLPELRSAPRWQRRGLAVLQDALPVHVHPDGVYFEQATQYHRYTTEFYLHLVLLADANGVVLAPHVKPTLERLFEHLLFLARPDGTIPLFGDDDGGRLIQLDARTPDDTRSLLAAGAVVFDRADFAFAARGDLAGMIWMLGERGFERFHALAPTHPSDLTRAFEDGGYYVSRTDWSKEADWMAFDSGPHGVMNGGHAHADALSFEIAVGGRPVFVDSGTYAYAGAERNQFREAAAHNTVTLDGISSSVPSAAPFRWSRSASVKGERWHTSEHAVFVAGSHDGYASLPIPANHSRAILHVAGSYWVIRDTIASQGAHEVAVRFHCAAGLDSCIRAGAKGNVASASVTEIGADAPILQMAIFGREGNLTVEDGWVSRQYGVREHSQVIVWRQYGTGPQEVVSFLLPTAGTTDGPVTELPDLEGGRAFLIPRDEGEDLLILGDGGPITVRGVETDAAWLWLRRDRTGRVREYVAIDASYGRVDRADLWTAGMLAWRASAVVENSNDPRARAL